MFKVLLIVVLVINGVRGQSEALTVEEAVLDVIYEDASDLLIDLVKHQKDCNKIDPSYVDKHVKALHIYKGIALKIFEALIKTKKHVFDVACEILQCPGGITQQLAIQKRLTQRSLDLKQLFYGYLTVLHTQFNVGSKASAQLLTCYLKKLNEKTVALFPEPELSKVVANFVQSKLNPGIQILEQVKGAAKTDCVLQPGITNPSPFNSIFVATMRAINNVQDNP